MQKGTVVNCAPVASLSSKSANKKRRTFCSISGAVRISVMVGAAGFEPTASSSRTRRATNCAMPRKYRNPMGCGLVGDERIELPQVESESTALPLCKSPLFGFALSTEALLTRNIIQPPPPFVNHFFDFSVHVFSAFSTTAFSRLFSFPALDTRPLWEYSYSIIYLPLLRENGRNEGCSI